MVLLIPNSARVAFTIPLIALVVSRRLRELLLWLVNKAPSAILLVFKYSCKVLQVPCFPSFKTFYLRGAGIFKKGGLYNVLVFYSNGFSSFGDNFILH